MFEDIKKEIEKYRKILKTVEIFKTKEPKGYLKYQEKGGRFFYYEAITNMQTGREEKKYIKRKDINLAKRLAQKHYYARVKVMAEKNLKELERFHENYDVEGIDRIYENLSNARKVLIEPVKGSKAAAIKEWNTLKEENTAPFQEHRKYKTEQGELVRSKSETIIANALYARSDILAYKYETSLELLDRGKKVLMHPDFRVINLYTGKIKLWEHMGMMDNANYANEFVTKVNTYINNGYIPGKDVFFTFETSGIPLDTRTVKRIIDEICRY